MSKYWSIFVLTSLALTAPALAGAPAASGDPQSACLQQGYSSSSQASPLDPYAHLLPTDLDMTSFELSNSYSIELKSFRADDMSQYQFIERMNTRDVGAGYSSPYLWEAGNGPGMMYPGGGAWGSPLEGRAYSPIPMPGR